MAEIANTRFKGRSGLVLLWIDAGKVSAEVRYENLVGGEDLFPHIYGALETGAVIEVTEVDPWPDGGFVPPEGVGESGLRGGLYVRPAAP